MHLMGGMLGEYVEFAGKDLSPWLLIPGCVHSLGHGFHADQGLVSTPAQSQGRASQAF